MTGLENIQEEIRIDAPRERVWDVLTREGVVEHWLGCLGYRSEIGALFYMQPDPAKRQAGDIDGATHCELIALDPPERMRFSWFMPGTPKTLVEIVLADNGDGSTTTSLCHSGWDQFEADQIRAIRDMLAGGWKSFVLPGLKRVVEEQGNAGSRRKAGRSGESG